MHNIRNLTDYFVNVLGRVRLLELVRFALEARLLVFQYNALVINYIAIIANSVKHY